MKASSSLMRRPFARFLSPGPRPSYWRACDGTVNTASLRSFSQASSPSSSCIVGMYQNGQLTDGAQRIDQQCDGALSRQVELCGSMNGKVGEALALFDLAGRERIALVGLGEDPSNRPEVKRPARDASEGKEDEEAKGEEEKRRVEAERAVHKDALPDYADNVRNATCAGAKLLRKEGSEAISVEAMGNPQASAEGAHLGLYSYDRFKSKKETHVRLDLLDGDERDQSMWSAGKHIADSQVFARTLAECPSNFMTPEIFANTVVEELQDHMSVEVRDESWAREQEMRCFLGVAQGSSNPLRLVEMRHDGGDAGDPPIVLVGKGVTFDSGGISLKPGKGMGMMRGDMGGAAAVAGAMRAISKLGIPKNVVGITPLCENMPSGTALKPGDVLTAKNGKTVEVDNTDAEGRLILADALVYAQEAYSPSVMIDLATLTGAMAMALGEQVTGVFSSDDELFDAMAQAGHKAGERVWRMPLMPSYQRLIKSDLADMINTGKTGAISAAFFLKEFVTTPHWMHMDIAGSAMVDAPSGYVPKGMTGQPVRALVEYLRSAQ